VSSQVIPGGIWNNAVFCVMLTRLLLLLLLSITVNRASAQLELILLECNDSALIGSGHPGSAGITNGYEGGVAFLQGKTFHLFVTEQPHLLEHTRTGHWISDDGLQWQRLATVQQSSDDSLNPRFGIWSPMPVYNEHKGRWDLFYVGYNLNGASNGQVFRAISEKKGRQGLNGPYRDVSGTVISCKDPGKNTWEGIQGTDSFFPFRVGKKWMAFYGSSDAASYWDVGLAEADSLEGRWKRIIGPPVLTLAENPIVEKLSDGTYLAVYDDLTDLRHNNRIGYAWSTDGLHWEHAFLTIPLPAWTRHIRTPESLIPAGKDEYWIYLTGAAKGNFYPVGRIKVRVSRR